MFGMDPLQEPYSAATLGPNHQFANLRDDTDLPKRGIGPANSMMKALIETFPDEHFIFVMFAVGGSNVKEWGPDRSTGFTVQYKDETSTFYEVLLKGIEEAVDGRDVSCAALVWMQGEADSRELELAENYDKNFDRFYRSLQKDLGVVDLPLIIGEVNPPLKTHRYRETVRTLQVKMAQKYANAVLVDTDDLAKLEDELHYTAGAELILGERFFEAYMQLMRHSH